MEIFAKENLIRVWRGKIRGYIKGISSKKRVENVIFYKTKQTCGERVSVRSLRERKRHTGAAEAWWAHISFIERCATHRSQDRNLSVSKL